tara:strand:+ start:6594 stop:6752 length:159 start_codon:yes stop_codon:yes gene_type:complete
MDTGDLVLQALMTILIAAMVYLWFLACLMPYSGSILDIQEKLDNATEQLTPP